MMPLWSERSVVSDTKKQIRIACLRRHLGARLNVVVFAAAAAGGFWSSLGSIVWWKTALVRARIGTTRSIHSPPDLERGAS